ncbi:MAG: hypothetical protein R3C28_13375 [Pirellulaceae bacterium]
MSSIRLGTSANIATRLSEMAAQIPHSLAVAAPRGRNPQGKQTYQRLTFGELEDDTNCIAAGLQNMGIVPGMHHFTGSSRNRFYFANLRFVQDRRCHCAD